MATSPQPKILIVDDEPYIRRILSFKLRLAEYLPVEAESGEVALEMIDDVDPALVLLDVTMPTPMSGFDVCRRLRQSDRHARIPIIMLTARNQPTDRALGVRLGVDGYITKPFSTREVIAMIDDLLALDEARAVVR